LLSRRSPRRTANPTANAPFEQPLADDGSDAILDRLRGVNADQRHFTAT
jgi:hypothetical protein